MRLSFARAAVLAALTGSTIVVAASCGGSDKKPPAGIDDIDGSDPERTDARVNNADGSTDAAEDAEIPATCQNTVRDGVETDTDCGGNVCPKCIDGKNCVADTDCAGGSCLNKICTTAKCSDGATNGDESDTDCGGKTCARCTIGKRCAKGDDCVSGACTNNACACPTGMAIVSKSTGGAYCVDATEVTKAQYNKFINANVNVADQIAVCKAPANTTFVPRGGWPPAQTPPAVNPTGLPFNLSLPVHYVDWCDAYAYCKWSNKQLCGQINGGAVAPEKANSADAGAWYNACSAQGTKAWPYSSTYEVGKCNGMPGKPGPETLPDAGRGYGYGGANQDEGLYVVNNSDINGNYTMYLNAQCQGGAVGLFQMSGNAAEWEDSCNGDTTSSQCRVRGGSYTAADDQDQLRCDAVRTVERMPAPTGDPTTDPLADVGIRCCLY